MTIHLVVESTMLPIPSNIEVLDDWGEITVIPHAPIAFGHDITGVGRHMMIRGTDEAIYAWLGHLDGFWCGEGSPVFGQFEIRHIPCPPNVNVINNS